MKTTRTTEGLNWCNFLRVQAQSWSVASWSGWLPRGCVPAGSATPGSIGSRRPPPALINLINWKGTRPANSWMSSSSSQVRPIYRFFRGKIIFFCLWKQNRKWNNPFRFQKQVHEKEEEKLLMFLPINFLYLCVSELQGYCLQARPPPCFQVLLYFEQCHDTHAHRRPITVQVHPSISFSWSLRRWLQCYMKRNVHLVHNVNMRFTALLIVTNNFPL